MSLIKPQPDWNLSQWLFHLENQSAQEIQLGLERIKTVAQSLLAERGSTVIISVAGTNGKGSTVTALGAIYHTAGYQVGTYTSPHLLRFNERIRLNGTEIPDHELCALFYEIERQREAIFLTYFETTTLAALLYFQRSAVDVMILEVGLGGRLDATNCMDADLSIITTIDFDHQDYLGDNLESIGYEKAGILRSGKPFIYADNTPPASVCAVAARLNTQSYYFGKDYNLQCKEGFWNLLIEGQLLSKFHWNNHLPLPVPSIQLKSAAAAIMASQALSDRLPVTDTELCESMSHIHISGRIELCPGPVSILYDVSHNAQSARLLADYLEKLKWKGRVYAVFSALKDKDILQLILPVKDCVHRWFPAQLDNKRAASASDLLHKFAQAQISVNFCYNSPLVAFNEAFIQATEGDLIVVFGSFYTVSQVMAERGRHSIHFEEM